MGQIRQTGGYSPPPARNPELIAPALDRWPGPYRRRIPPEGTDFLPPPYFAQDGVELGIGRLNPDLTRRPRHLSRQGPLSPGRRGVVIPRNVPAVGPPA